MAIVPTLCQSNGARFVNVSRFLDNSYKASSLLSGFLKFNICYTIFSNSLSFSLVYYYFCYGFYYYNSELLLLFICYGFMYELLY